MRLKEGVSLDGVKAETVAVMYIVDDAYDSLGKQLWITSTTDGKHSKNSAHYKGLAFDARTRESSGSMTKWSDEFKLRLAKRICEYLGYSVPVIIMPDDDGGCSKGALFIAGEWIVLIESTHLHIQRRTK